MMRSTAAIQVNVDLGPPADVDARWRLTHALGPVLAAAFANGRTVLVEGGHLIDPAHPAVLEFVGGVV